MDPRKLARDLKLFKAPDGSPIKPANIKLEDGRVPKGYRAEQFEDAWKRYLNAPMGEALPPLPALPETNALPAALQPVADVAVVADPPKDASTGPRDHHGNGIPGFPGVIEAIRAFLEDQPDAEPQDISEELGYADVTARAALARIREEES